MDNGLKIAQVAALIGDPARANMLVRLMDGTALTASELAFVSGVSPQTASGHLAKLSEAGLLALEKQGRHRYFRLASPLVGHMLEALGVVAHDKPGPQTIRWRGGEALRRARTCYDHMAGRLAVAIADALVERSHVMIGQDGGTVASSGLRFFRDIGVDLPEPGRRRIFCRPCLDWSERRPHLAGAIGAALLQVSLERGWVERTRDSRALTIRQPGRLAFGALFGIAETA